MNGLGPECHKQLWHSVQGLETEIVLAVCWDRLINCWLNSLLVFQNIVCGDGFYLESAYLFCLWYKCLPHAVLSDFESSYVEKKPITKQKDCWTIKTESFFPTIFWLGLLIIFVRIAAAAVQAKQFRPPPPSCLHVSLGGLKWRCNPCSMSWSAPCLLPGWSSPINLCLKCIQRIGLRGQPNF